MSKIVVRERGQITLPVEVRDDMGLQTDAVLEVTQLSKGAVLLSKPSRMTEIAVEMEGEMKKRGLTLDDVLAELKAVRQERFGKKSK